MADSRRQRNESFPSRWVLTSNKREIVHDGAPGQHSPFVAALLDALDKTDEPLSVTRLSQLVLEKVAPSAYQLPLAAPLAVKGHQGGEFVFHFKISENNALQDQVLLQTLGYFKGEADGRMSEEFKQAVISFQKNRGLFADGIIGRQTREAMLRALEEIQERLKVENAVPAMWQNLARSVCQINLPSGNRGTGFLSEGGYIFTANYILPNADAASRANAIFADPEGLSPFYFELDERDFITNEGDISFTRVKIKDWDVEKTQPFGQLSISTEPPGTSEKVSLIFFEENVEEGPKFLLNKPISSVHQFDILFDAPETEPGAGGAPVFNERGEVVALYYKIVDYMELRQGILMKEILWYIHASQGNRFNFWRGLVERGFTADVLEKMQADYPDLDELKSYAAEHQKIHAELKEGKLPHEEFERQFNRIGYQLNGLIELLESRGNKGSYAA